MDRQTSVEESSATENDESSSEDDDEDEHAGDEPETIEDEGDGSTIGAPSLHQSTMTLCVDSMAELLTEETTAGRLLKVTEFQSVFV